MAEIDKGYPLKMTYGEYHFVKVYAAVRDITINDAIRSIINKERKNNKEISKLSHKEGDSQ